MTYTLSQHYCYQWTYPVPVYSQLAEPVKGCHIVTSSLNELFYDVTSVYLDSHKTDDLQTLYLCEVWSDSLWELVQHSNLKIKAKLCICSNTKRLKSLNDDHGLLMPVHSGHQWHDIIILRVVPSLILAYLFTFETLESFFISSFFSRSERFSDISCPLHLRWCDAKL